MIDFEKIKQAGEKAAASAEFVGLAVAVIEGDKVTYSRGFGKTRFEQGTDVTAQTLFPYASICKTLCSILIMRLVEEGKLDLDTPVVEYLAGFTFRNMAYGKRVTLRHLLSHTSGLPDGGRMTGLATEDALARAIWEEIPHYRFSAEPGLLTNYASTAICIAGYIAEVVMGRSYDLLLNEYLLEPLKMHSCTYDLQRILLHPLVLPHHLDADGNVTTRDRYPMNRAGHPSSFYVGTIDDLAKVAVMLLNAGQLLSADSLATMMTAMASTHVSSTTHWIQRQETAFALGLKIGEYRGVRMVRHGGTTPGYQHFFQLFPDQNRAVVMLTSHCSGENDLLDFVGEVQDAVLELEPSESDFRPKPAPIPLPSNLDLTQLTGRYLNPERGNIVSITIDEGQLTIDAFDQKRALRYTDSGEFVADLADIHECVVMPVRFLLNADGLARHVIVFGTPYKRNNETPPATPDLSLWQHYVGCYHDPFNTYSEHFLTVSVDDNVLFIQVGYQDKKVATPLGENRFLSGLGVAEFELSAENKVIALQIGHTARYRQTK